MRRREVAHWSAAAPSRGARRVCVCAVALPSMMRVRVCELRAACCARVL